MNYQKRARKLMAGFDKDVARLQFDIDKICQQVNRDAASMFSRFSNMFEKMFNSLGKNPDRLLILKCILECLPTNYRLREHPYLRTETDRITYCVTWLGPLWLPWFEWMEQQPAQLLIFDDKVIVRVEHVFRRKGGICTDYPINLLDPEFFEKLLHILTSLRFTLLNDFAIGRLNKRFKPV